MSTAFDISFCGSTYGSRSQATGLIIPVLLEVAQSSLIELGFGVLRVIVFQGLLRPTLKRVDGEPFLHHVLRILELR